MPITGRLSWWTSSPPEAEQGKILKLIRLWRTDGNPGLLKAIKDIYPFLKVQRCVVYKLRNVAVKRLSIFLVVISLRYDLSRYCRPATIKTKFLIFFLDF